MHMMEAEERPMKLRKLDSGDSAAPNSSEVSPLPDLGLSAPASPKSKPEEPAADVAGSPDEYPEGEVETPVDDDGEDAEEDAHASTLTATEQNGNPTKPMSKNRMKKLRKLEEWEAGREYRKAKRKEKLQAKKARRRTAKEEEKQRLALVAETDTKTPTEDANTATSTDLLSGSRNAKSRYHASVPVTIVIDCGFDDLMMDKERISLGSQITRSYSDHFRAPFQPHLVICSWGGVLKRRFDTVLSKHYLNWKRVTFTEADFVEAARNADQVMRGPQGGDLVGVLEKVANADGKQANNDEAPKPAEDAEKPPTLDSAPSHANGHPEHDITGTSQDLESAQKDVPPTRSTPTSASASAYPGEVVYLTSDSPDTLTALSPYSTYIVGGLVDKNRHKGICYQRACERGIKTAKLPIGEYMDMRSRKVLATNHVVEIMIRWLECGDWGEAFMQVIPKRKGGKLKEDEPLQGDDGGSSQDEDDGPTGDEENRQQGA